MRTKHIINVIFVSKSTRTKHCLWIMVPSLFFSSYLFGKKKHHSNPSSRPPGYLTGAKQSCVALLKHKLWMKIQNDGTNLANTFQNNLDPLLNLSLKIGSYLYNEISECRLSESLLVSSFETITSSQLTQTRQKIFISTDFCL